MNDQSEAAILDAIKAGAAPHSGWCRLSTVKAEVGHLMNREQFAVTLAVLLILGRVRECRRPGRPVLVAIDA